MLQIMTIKEQDPAVFDNIVNAALTDGWKLVRRTSMVALGFFLAELEKEIITEAEPCASCSEDCDKWEAWE